MATIKDYSSLPIFKSCNFLNQPLSVFNGAIYEANSKESYSSAYSAVQFYTLNKLATVIKDNIHNSVELREYEGVYKAYCDCVLEHGMQAFIYMLCICIKESRHLGNIAPQYTKLPAYDLWEALCSGFSVTKFIEKTHSDSPFGGVTICQLLDLLQIVYYDHSWGASFGGRKWGNINDQVKKLAAGDISLELLLDTVFTLAHNTGNIFNKGFMFTSVGQGTLIKILDVQRSGQMPEYVLEGVSSLGDTQTTELKDYISQVQPLQAFNTEVDWELVNTLGSVGKYLVKAKPKPVVSIPKMYIDFGAVEEKVTTDKFNIPLSDATITMVQIHPSLIVEKHINVRKKKKAKHLKSIK